MPRTKYSELPEPVAQAVQGSRMGHGPLLAASVAKHLRCDVTFSHWEPPTFSGGPETPVFIVPEAFCARAKAIGLSVRCA